MRKNLPITNHEYVLADDDALVSTTDLKGKITYANASFIAASGFAEDELIGQPHNLVRHPDMPPAAFGDLWQTIKSGRTWTAAVKNRRKDGGFYWVRANVTPMLENGRIIGFMSVRTKPAAADVAGAQALYAAMNSGTAGGGEVRGRHRHTDRLGRAACPHRKRTVATTYLGVALAADCSGCRNPRGHGCTSQHGCRASRGPGSLRDRWRLVAQPLGCGPDHAVVATRQRDRGRSDQRAAQFEAHRRARPPAA